MLFHHTHIHKCTKQIINDLNHAFIHNVSVASALVTITLNCHFFNGEKLQLKQRERERELFLYNDSAHPVVHTYTLTHTALVQFLCLFLNVCCLSIGKVWLRIALKAF